MSKRALIFGIGGQDGALLAQFLLKKGYDVWGSSRSVDQASFANLQRMEVAGSVSLLSLQPDDKASVQQALGCCSPHEIYYLAAQSSVGLSFVDPEDTVRSGILGILNVLEAVRVSGLSSRVFFAGSGECFGDTRDVPASENTPYHPTSPYAVTKAAASWLVRNYRENFGVFASTGILFNHESPLRSERFVTQKIITGARQIAEGLASSLSLGQLNIWRDWGWAPEYVDAMWRMLQLPEADDFVLATGRSYSLKEFVAAAFELHGLDWQKYVIESCEFQRPSDIVCSRADPSKASRVLGWKAQFDMYDVVRLMSRGT